MVDVSLWLLLLLVALLLVALLLRQSAAISDQCSKHQEEKSRLERDIASITELKHKNELHAAKCDEHLKKQILNLEATDRKLEQSEADNSGLKKQLEEYETKFQQSEAVNSRLKKQLEEYKTKFQQSQEVVIDLKKQLQIKKDVLNSLDDNMQKLFDAKKPVWRVLLDAAKSGDVNIVKMLFKCSNDNCTDNDKYCNTPLTYAARYDHVEVVRVLLEGGTKVDRAIGDKQTALHQAARYGNLAVCRLLLDKGANVDPVDTSKVTPLHLAAGEGYESVVELLVEKGADVSWKDGKGRTALHNAARSGHLLVAKLLVERGADVSVKDDDGRTASDLAWINRKKDVKDWLDLKRDVLRIVHGIINIGNYK